MTFLTTFWEDCLFFYTVEYIYEPAFTEETTQQQKESVQKCIANLLLVGANVDEKVSTKINRLLLNLYEYDTYLQRELEAYCVTQE